MFVGGGGEGEFEKRRAGGGSVQSADLGGGAGVVASGKIAVGIRNRNGGDERRGPVIVARGDRAAGHVGGQTAGGRGGLRARSGTEVPRHCAR